MAFWVKELIPIYMMSAFRLDTVTDFFIKLGRKPCMHLVEISIFSLNHVIARPTKIMNNLLTLFETENESQKTKPVPIIVPRASRNFPDVKTRNEIFFYNWTSEIIPFICFEMSKVAFFIVIQLCYNELWPFSH